MKSVAPLKVKKARNLKSKRPKLAAKRAKRMKLMRWEVLVAHAAASQAPTLR
jgi:hypothetical protein